MYASSSRGAPGDSPVAIATTATGDGAGLLAPLDS